MAVRTTLIRILACLAALAAGLVAATAATAAPKHEMVVGGAPAAAGGWPSIVALASPGADALTGQFCGGTLIAPTVVLTAAHCVIEDGVVLPPTGVDVIAGTSDLTAPSERIPVVAVRPHPAFAADGDPYDAALLFLSRPGAAPPAAYARSGQDADVLRPGAIAGWGETRENSGDYPSALLEAPVTIYPAARCQQSLGGAFVRGAMICAGDLKGGVDSCSGDSGGPLRDETGLVVGITSWGVGCARAGLPGVYTRVSSLTSWIDRTIAAPGASAATTAARRPVAARALRTVARAGSEAHLRYRLLGNGERTRETIVVTAGEKVIARIRTTAGPARPDLEYLVGWKVPSRLAEMRGLRFCVTSRVVGGPAGTASCAPLRLDRSRRS